LTGDLQVLQAALTAQRLLALAGSGGGAHTAAAAAAAAQRSHPLVLCGDFNSKPKTELHQLLRHGCLSTKQLAGLRRHAQARCPLTQPHALIVDLSKVVMILVDGHLCALSTCGLDAFVVVRTV
jgi:endonuclease/exonuclease/phosphatase family metal-dependent hydrolase